MTGKHDWEEQCWQEGKSSRLESQLFEMPKLLNNEQIPEWLIA